MNISTLLSPIPSYSPSSLPDLSLLNFLSLFRSYASSHSVCVFAVTLAIVPRRQHAIEPRSILQWLQSPQPVFCLPVTPGSCDHATQTRYLMSPSTRATQLLWVTLRGGGVCSLSWPHLVLEQWGVPTPSHSWVYTGEVLAT